MSRSALWGRKDLGRIRSRYFTHAGDLAPAEVAYLRAWALLLRASDLDIGEEDRSRLRWMVAWIDGEREREAA
jgi:hypothetical protein